MKLTKAMLMVAMLALFGGCAVVPASPEYNVGPTVHVAPGPVYVAPAPIYYAAPGYYAPAVRFGIYGRWHGRRGR